MTGHRPHLLPGLIIATALSLPGMAGHALAAADSGGAERVYAALPRVEIALETDGARTVFELPHERLLVGSERVTLDGRLLSPLIEYRVDYDSGTLHLLGEPPPPLTSLSISYRHLPLDELPVPRLLIPMTVAAHRGEAGRLDLRGSKGLGLRLDSLSGLGIVQSLDVSLSGELPGGLRIEGNLSDQSLPVTVEGTTAELGEIDVIRLSAWTANMRLDLGDYSLSGPLGSVVERYGPGDRRLEGAQLRLTYDDWGARAVLNVSASQSAAYRFSPDPGVAGPYLLRGSYGETNVMVVPGSEKVYLDGILLTRGLDADYIIDYSRGSLTFSPTMNPAPGAEALVRFEYTARGYRRSLYGGGLRLSLGRLDWTLGYYDERDDADADLWGMSDEDRRLLEQAGDRPVTRPLEGPGAFEYVGEGQGEYELVYDEQTGNYSFRPAPGGGYRRRSWTLPAPRSHRLALMTVGLDLSWLRGEVELALSEYDANTLSTLDNEDNDGLAYRFGFSGEAPLGEAALFYELDGERREADFRALRPAESVPGQRRRWGFEPDERSKRNLLEGRLGYRFSFGPSLWLGGGLLEVESPGDESVLDPVGEPSFRRLEELSAGLEWPTPIGLTYLFRSQGGVFGTAGRPTRELSARIHRLELAPELGELRPRASLALEERRGDPDRRLESLGLGLGWRPTPRFGLDYDLEAYRDFGPEAEGRRLEMDSLAHRLGLFLHQDSLRLRLDYLRRTARDRRERPLEEDGTTDTGRLGLGWAPWRGGVTLSLDYELARSWSYPLIEQFVYSPDGVGFYRREPDPADPEGWIYIFDPGDPEAYYDRELLPAGEPVRAINAAGGLAFSLKPRRFSREPWAGLFEIDTSLRLRGEGPGSTLERAFFTGLFDDEALSGEIESRTTLTLWPGIYRGGLSGTFSWNEGLDARLRPRRQRWGGRSWQLRGDYAPLDWLRLFAGGEVGREWRSGVPAYYGAGDTERVVDYHELWVEPRLTFGPWRPRLRGEFRGSRQEAPAGVSLLTSWTVHPALNISLGRVGVLEISWRRRSHTLEGPPTTESMLYRRPGVDHRWRLWLSVNLGTNLVLSLGYTGDAQPRRETVHRGELGVRLLF